MTSEMNRLWAISLNISLNLANLGDDYQIEHFTKASSGRAELEFLFTNRLNWELIWPRDRIDIYQRKVSFTPAGKGLILVHSTINNDPPPTRLKWIERELNRAPSPPAKRIDTPTYTCNWHSRASSVGQWHDLLSKQHCSRKFTQRVPIISFFFADITRFCSPISSVLFTGYIKLRLRLPQIVIWVHECQEISCFTLACDNWRIFVS